MKEVSTEVFKEVIDKETKVLVDFYSPTCNPCRTLARVIGTLDTEYTIVSVDIEKNTELADEYNVQHLPTVVIINDSKEISRFSGLKNKTQIKELLV